MKKLIAIVLAISMSFGLLVACASDSMNDSNLFEYATADIALPMASPAEAPVMAMPMPEMERMGDMGFGVAGGEVIYRNEEVFVDDIDWDNPKTLTPEMPVLPDAPAPIPPEHPEPPRTEAGDGFAEKIIYTVSADIETLEFDRTIEIVNEMLRTYGAFVESSNIGGRNHWQISRGELSYRNAFFTLRVPQDRLDAMTNSLEALGNVLSIRNFAENITAQFVDTEARLNALKIQEERLLVMLGRAEEIADMIVIEQSLADVRYQIESITSTLRNWENRIRFSTLHLYIQEVHEYTEIEPEEIPYWQEIRDGLINTFHNIGLFFSNLLKWFIINLPVLILLAVFIGVALLITHKLMFKKRTKKEKNKLEQKEEKE